MPERLTPSDVKPAGRRTTDIARRMGTLTRARTRQIEVGTQHRGALTRSRAAVDAPVADTLVSHLAGPAVSNAGRETLTEAVSGPRPDSQTADNADLSPSSAETRTENKISAAARKRRSGTLSVWEGHFAEKMRRELDLYPPGLPPEPPRGPDAEHAEEPEDPFERVRERLKQSIGGLKPGSLEPVGLLESLLELEEAAIISKFDMLREDPRSSERYRQIEQELRDLGPTISQRVHEGTRKDISGYGRTLFTGDTLLREYYTSLPEEQFGPASEIPELDEAEIWLDQGHSTLDQMERAVPALYILARQAEDEDFRQITWIELQDRKIAALRIAQNDVRRLMQIAIETEDNKRPAQPIEEKGMWRRAEDSRTLHKKIENLVRRHGHNVIRMLDFLPDHYNGQGHREFGNLHFDPITVTHSDGSAAEYQVTIGTLFRHPYGKRSPYEVRIPDEGEQSELRIPYIRLHTHADRTIHYLLSKEFQGDKVVYKIGPPEDTDNNFLFEVNKGLGYIVSDMPPLARKKLDEILDALNDNGTSGYFEESQPPPPDGSTPLGAELLGAPVDGTYPPSPDQPSHGEAFVLARAELENILTEQDPSNDILRAMIVMAKVYGAEALRRKYVDIERRDEQDPQRQAAERAFMEAANELNDTTFPADLRGLFLFP